MIICPYDRPTKPTETARIHFSYLRWTLNMGLEIFVTDDHCEYEFKLFKLEIALVLGLSLLTKNNAKNSTYSITLGSATLSLVAYLISFRAQFI